LDSSFISDKKLDFAKIKKIRGSISIIPALLYFFGNIQIPTPGGCNI
jgi:UDP-N-acetylglucosamine enolpyruvyl transferase